MRRIKIKGGIKVMAVFKVLSMDELHRKPVKTCQNAQKAVLF